MNVIALVVVAMLSAGTCEVLSSTRQSKQAPKDAFAGLSRYLDKLKGNVDFVTSKDGTYRFWPKGLYRGITYDGSIATHLIPNEANNSFTVVTSIYVKGQWKEAERTEMGAAELLAKLGQNQGTALGIPDAMRRDMSASSIHRRVVCGIPLSEEVKQAPR